MKKKVIYLRLDIPEGTELPWQGELAHEVGESLKWDLLNRAPGISVLAVQASDVTDDSKPSVVDNAKFRQNI